MPHSVPLPDGINEIDRHILIGLEKIGMALKNQSWQDAGQQGLTPTQGQIITLLVDTDGVGLSTLVKNLGVTAATVSDAVSTLVEKGLVQKTRSAIDGRAIAITLTTTGQQAANQSSTWSDFLLTTVDELTPEEKVIFLRGLIKMIKKLQIQGKISVAKMCVTCRFFVSNRYPDSEYPHHCGLVDVPFADGDLRINCAEHAIAES
jgi:DNA-binding MarR family transcriptional regulator